MVFGGSLVMLVIVEVVGLIWAIDDIVMGVEIRIVICWVGVVGNKIRWICCVVWGFEVILKD